MIRVSFSLFLSLSVFCYFTLLIFMKIIIIIFFFSLKLFLFFHVPGCSGMFRHVPACSGMFHVPGFIDAHNYWPAGIGVGIYDFV